MSAWVTDAVFCVLRSIVTIAGCAREVSATRASSLSASISDAIS